MGEMSKEATKRTTSFYAVAGFRFDSFSILAFEASLHSQAFALVLSGAALTYSMPGGIW